jgi:hypothetical protein
MRLIIVYRRILAAGLAAAVAILAAGCSTVGGGSAAEKIVLERAQARWNAMVERDWNTAYPYLVPAYRAVVPLKRYGNQFTGPIQWETAKATEATCEERRCTVKVEIAFRMMLPGHMDRLSTTFVEEVWVLEQDGQWYKFESV